MCGECYTTSLITAGMHLTVSRQYICLKDSRHNTAIIFSLHILQANTYMCIIYIFKCIPSRLHSAFSAELISYILMLL